MSTKPALNDGTPVRMMRFDYAPDFSRIKDLDLEEVARSRKEDWRINCEWIVGTVGFEGRGYQTTFKTDSYEMYPGFEDFDYLRSYTPYAHKYGISVISYLNMHWYDYAFGDKHHDWEQITADGQVYGKVNPLYGCGTTFCVNSPWRDWAIELISQAMKTGIDGVFLDGPVVFTDCCHCASCRQLFKDKYGADIPKEDWRSDLWKDFLDFREDSLARFLADAQKAVKTVNPKGIIFLNAGNWAPQSWRVARDIQKTAPFQDFDGAEAFFHYGKKQNIYAATMAGKYLRAACNSTVVFAHYMNGNWHYLNLPAGEVQLHISQTAAIGANPWLALLERSLEHQPQSHQPVKELYGFLADNEQYYKDAQPVAETALLFSAATGRLWLSQTEDIYEGTQSGKEENLVVTFEKKQNANLSERKQQCEQILAASYEGYFSALTRSHIPFDIVLDEGINPESLAKYKTLVLGDGACLSESATEAVRKFVENGGNLAASFEAGHYDERGNPTDRLFDLLGIDKVDGAFNVMMGENYVKIDQDHLGFNAGGMIERGNYVLNVQAATDTETPALFMEPLERSYVAIKGVTKYPAIIMKKSGKGRVIYFPEAIGQFVGETGMISAEQRITRAVELLNGKPLLETNLPKSVSVEMYRQEKTGRFMIHLMNNTVDNRPVNEFLPVHDIELTLNIPQNPAKVFGLRENGNLEFSRNETSIKIKIPRLKMYEVVVIEE